MKTPQVVLTLLLLVITIGCDDDGTKAKNLEELYAEKGIPVKVEVIKPQPFSVYDNYFAKLSGIEETSEYSPIAEKIHSVRYKVGDWVREGQVVIQFPSSNPGTEYYQAKETYENAKTSFERIKSLYEKGGISRQDFDNSKTQYEVAKANWNAIRQSIKIEAPMSGVITKINVQPSDNVDEEQELFTVSKLNKLKASVWVPEKDIIRYKVGQKASAKWNDAVLEGQVIQVNRSVHEVKQAFEVIVQFNNPGMVEQTGMTAEIVVETYYNPQAFSINRRFVVERENKSWVYVAEGDSAQLKPVEVGGSNGSNVEIKTGLKTGEKLITEGLLLISDGKKINIKN